MNNELLLSIAAILFTGTLLVLAWFFPKKVFQINEKTKGIYLRLFPFFPRRLLDFLFWFDNQPVQILTARLSVSIGFLLSLLM
jgi:hypothetical protein